MSQTTPPSITPAPTPAPSRGDKSTFSNRVDAFVTWLITAVTEFGNVATNVYNNAVDAYNNAVSANTSKNNAATSETNALGYKNDAAASASDAQTYATAALNSLSSPSFTDTSTSSNSIGSGTKTFTVTAGKNWGPGMSLLMFNSTTNQQRGNVVTYSGTTLTVSVGASDFTGSGTYTSWSISPDTKNITKNHIRYIGGNN